MIFGVRLQPQSLLDLIKSKHYDGIKYQQNSVIFAIIDVFGEDTLFIHTKLCTIFIQENYPINVSSEIKIRFRESIVCFHENLFENLCTMIF